MSSFRRVPVEELIAKVEEAIQNIKNLREEAYQEKVTLRMESSQRRRLFGLLPPRPKTREEIMEELEDGRYDTFGISWKTQNNNMFWRDMDTLRRLRHLCTTFEQEKYINVDAEEASQLRSWLGKSKNQP